MDLLSVTRVLYKLCHSSGMFSVRKEFEDTAADRYAVDVAVAMCAVADALHAGGMSARFSWMELGRIRVDCQASPQSAVTAIGMFSA